jgi:hypothetical protein
MPICAKRQHPPVWSPRFRQFGGCSRLNRRFCVTKIRNAVAIPVLPAGKCGSNFRKCHHKMLFTPYSARWSFCDNFFGAVIR